MTTKEFIEKAIEGGWNPIPEYWNLKVEDRGISLNGDDGDEEYYPLDKMLLDPKAWEAVGKVEDWIHTEKQWCKLLSLEYSNKKDFVGREGEVVGESKDKKSWRVKWGGNISNYSYNKENIELLEKGRDYKEQMHRMIDSLCEGKSVEEFLETLN